MPNVSQAKLKMLITNTKNRNMSMTLLAASMWTPLTSVFIHILKASHYHKSKHDHRQILHPNAHLHRSSIQSSCCFCADVYLWILLYLHSLLTYNREFYCWWRLCSTRACGDAVDGWLSTPAKQIFPEKSGIWCNVLVSNCFTKPSVDGFLSEGSQKSMQYVNMTTITVFRCCYNDKMYCCAQKCLYNSLKKKNKVSKRSFKESGNRALKSNSHKFEPLRWSIRNACYKIMMKSWIMDTAHSTDTSGTLPSLNDSTLICSKPLVTYISIMTTSTLSNPCRCT